MTSDIQIRPYAPGDEAAILQLFHASFGQEMRPEFWRWRFADNPTGLTLIALAWAGDTLAAHYAVSPVTMRIDGADQLTALSMTTMTDPRFRGQGLFQRLALEVRTAMTHAGVALVWGFPNVHSHRGFVRDLGWSDIAEVPTFALPLDGREPPAPRVEAREGPAFSRDARVDELWDAVADRWRVHVRRDRAYLAWRFDANPLHLYTRLVAEDGDRLQGHVVFKAYDGGADVVDLMARDDATSRDLLLSAAAHARRAGLRSLRCWLNFTAPLHRELEGIGFRNEAPVTYFGGRVLAPAGALAAEYRHWHLAMSDSDLY